MTAFLTLDRHVGGTYSEPRVESVRVNVDRIVRYGESIKGSYVTLAEAEGLDDGGSRSATIHVAQTPNTIDMMVLSLGVNVVDEEEAAGVTG